MTYRPDRAGHAMEAFRRKHEESEREDEAAARARAAKTRRIAVKVVDKLATGDYRIICDRTSVRQQEWMEPRLRRHLRQELPAEVAAVAAERDLRRLAQDVRVHLTDESWFPSSRADVFWCLCCCLPCFFYDNNRVTVTVSTQPAVTAPRV